MPRLFPLFTPESAFRRAQYKDLAVRRTLCRIAKHQNPPDNREPSSPTYLGNIPPHVHLGTPHYRPLHLPHAKQVLRLHDAVLLERDTQVGERAVHSDARHVQTLPLAGRAALAHVRERV